VNLHRIHHRAIIGGEPNIVNNKECGKIKIGNDNTIKENVVIHNSSDVTKTTSIGNSCFIHSSVHVGHDVIIEDKVTLCVNVILAGHVVVMHNANLGLGCIIMQCCIVGPYCMINAGIFVTQNVLPFTVYTNRLNGTNCSTHINVIGLSRNKMTHKQLDEIESWYVVNKNNIPNNNEWFSDDINKFYVYVNDSIRKNSISTFGS
jgi:UDP-N-acetylglucosamine acyltransferase